MKRMLLFFVLVLFTFQGFSQFVDNTFKNSFYLHFGITNPKKAFKEEPDFYTPLGEKVGAERGFMFDMGTLFYFKDFSIISQVKPGIDIVWISASVNKINSQEALLGNLIGFWGFKIGPFISYSPFNNFFIDFRYKIAPNFATLFLPDSYFKYFGFGLRHDIGFNIRYKPIMVGLSSNFGNFIMNNSSNNFIMPSNTFNLVFGFSF